MLALPSVTVTRFEWPKICAARRVHRAPRAMLITVMLRGQTVEEAGASCRRALDEFALLAPRYLALDHWMRTSYQRALLGGPSSPTALDPQLPVDVSVTSAQCRLASARRAARRSRHAFVHELPERVHIARIEDASGRIGFAPVDPHGGAPLASRVLSIFIAECLSRPDHYMGDAGIAVSASEGRRHAEERTAARR